MFTSVFKVFPSIGKSLEGTGGRFPEDFHLNPSGVVSMTLIEVLFIKIIIIIVGSVPTFEVEGRAKKCSSKSEAILR